MTSGPNPYRVQAANNGGTESGGYIRGFAWGPPVVDEITMESLDRYRVTLDGIPDALLVQPMQTTVWVVPNAKTVGRGAESIDGDATWMFPETLPDVVVGEPMNFHLSFAPYEDTAIWHITSRVTSITATVDGTPVDCMTTREGANWLIGTESGATHQFNFTQRFPRHRRFPGEKASNFDGVPDRYVDHYSLYDIRTLKIGQPISLEALSLADERPFAGAATVATITNLFDRTLGTPN